MRVFVALRTKEISLEKNKKGADLLFKLSEFQ